MVLEKTLESPLDCTEIQPVHPKGNQSWMFIGRVEAETPVLWPPDVKKWLIGKDRDSWKDWRQEKGTTGDEMVGWHHWCDENWVNSGSWWWTGRPGELQSMGSQSQTWLSNWTEQANFYLWIVLIQGNVIFQQLFLMNISVILFNNFEFSSPVSEKK